MTPPDANAALQEASVPLDPPPERAKAVLFCPECCHEGHATSDWKARDDYVDGTRAIVCPDCATVVTERPLPTRSTNTVEASEHWSEAGTRTPWETWRDLWQSSVELVTTWPRTGRC